MLDLGLVSTASPAGYEAQHAARFRKTCHKLGVSFRNYLGARFGVAAFPRSHPLPLPVRLTGAPPGVLLRSPQRTRTLRRTSRLQGKGGATRFPHKFTISKTTVLAFQTTF